MTFDMFGNYDLAWRFGVSIGIIAGVVKTLFGGPSRTRWAVHGRARSRRLQRAELPQQQSTAVDVGRRADTGLVRTGMTRNLGSLPPRES